MYFNYLLKVIDLSVKIGRLLFRIWDSEDYSIYYIVVYQEEINKLVNK